MPKKWDNILVSCKSSLASVPGQRACGREAVLGAGAAHDSDPLGEPAGSKPMGMGGC